MKINLGPFTAAEIAVGFKPELALETQLYFAAEVCNLLGSIRASAAAVGEYTSAGGAGIPTGGREIVAVISSANGAVGSAEMSVTMNVTLDDDGADTATATFAVPTWSANADNTFGFGVARDLVPDTPANVAKKIKAIVSLDAVAGLNAGIKFDLYSTPNSTSFHLIGDTTRVEMPFDTPATVAIPSGYDPQAYTKIGRGELSNLSVSCKHFGVTEQLARFNGIMGTLRGDTRKEDQVVWERLLYSGFRPQVNVSKGEGNDEVEATAEGLYRTVMAGYGLAAA